MDLRPHWLIDLKTPIPDPLGLGQAAVEFIETLILPDGKPFRLVPEQRRIIEKIFGDVDEEGRRKVGVCYLHLPSGNAKTTLAGAIALLMLAHPKFRIDHGQVVIAAPTRKTGRDTSFAVVEGFIERMFPDEAERVLRFRVISNTIEQHIEHLPSGSTLNVLSRAPNAQEGLAVYCLIAEETHVWSEQANRLWDVLRKSFAKVVASDPLAVIATTAGMGVGGIGHSLYTQARDIAEGKATDESWLPVIYEADPDEDWQSEDVWRRLNFGLGVFKSLREMKNLAREAERSVTSRLSFLRYQLNRWLEGVGEAWIPPHVYDLGAEGFSIEAVRHLPCFVGVDAGQTSDLTFVVALFADFENRKFYVDPHAWCPAASIARRNEEDSVPYLDWEQAGYISETEGASIDEQVIEDRIRELYGAFDVQHIGFDPWNTRRMMGRLQDDGLPVVTIPQQVGTMSPAMKATEKLLLDGELIHANHAALRWCFLNVRAPIPDRRGNIMPDKSHRSLKIDGAVATMIAVFLAMVAEQEGPITFESLTGLPSRENADG